jgi:hypothetical protein
MPQASLTVYWNSFMIIFSLLHPVLLGSSPYPSGRSTRTFWLLDVYLYYKP